MQSAVRDILNSMPSAVISTDGVYAEKKHGAGLAISRDGVYAGNVRNGLQ